MLVVLTLRTAAVVALAVGAQAGVCRPGAPSYSSIQSQLTGNENFPSAAGTSPVYTDVMGKSDSETGLSTTAYQTPGEEPTRTGRPENQPGPTVVTTSSFASTSHPSGTMIQDTLSNAFTTSIAESVASTMVEQRPTTIAPETPTSQSCTKESGAATSSCANKPEPVCGQTGLFKDSHVYLITLFQQYDLAGCKAECEKRDDCKSIGFTSGNQCELYSTSVSAMEFEAEDGWYFSVYDTACFDTEGQ
ncbi:hypothetical protein Focb16_v006098 [Fusarium oxysporum f. sp. cubense]|uniref:Apple domain-containing protein n=2 Tax=Fusarium oxysporum f. sp. cubense TaxID=61366 RepID=N4U5D0_FUSC1|nr:hypothetical protein FOC1_g10000117 [Fusarium oxysporum f. sp. cubense race 1]TVY75431.1 hypothetical protein Focb16_v006098 [Fusarium oxysporum f. sp. cubense]